MLNSFKWILFYEALAGRLLEYQNWRKEIFKLMKKLSAEQPMMRYLNFGREDWWDLWNYVIDPFSVNGVLNRKVRAVKRIVLAKVYSDVFKIKACKR